MSQIGQNLKSARARAGFTQKDVEAKLGLRELSLKDYETERLKLPAAMALRLAELYRVSVDQLLGTEEAKGVSAPQAASLARVGSLFSQPEAQLLLLDPVIRAYLEGHQEKLMDHSVFELITLRFSDRQKKAFTGELLKTLVSLMGVDNKITREELSFIHGLIDSFGLDEKAKAITKVANVRYAPELEVFHDRPEAKHFLLWLMFFTAQSDGKINYEETAYTEECAEILKVSRSSYLFIKKFFVKEGR